MNIGEAKVFLEALGSREHTFQTFPDCKEVSSEMRRKQTRVFHGTFSQLLATLIKLNEEGAGIFVTINKTDGQGRKKENIVAIIAVFVDCDDGQERTPPIDPSIIVKTKHGFHYYFLLKEGECIDDFERTQKALIKRLNTDPAVKDVSRVMRVPGFLHQKDINDPFEIRLIKCNSNTRYSLAEIHKHFPLDEIDQPGQLFPKNHVQKNEEVIFTSNEVAATVTKGVKFMNVVGGGCKALTRTWNASECRHIERVALLSIAIRCEDGPMEIKNKWPSSMTDQQIEHAFRNKLVPYSCEKLQEEGICCEGDPIYGGRCLFPRSSSLVSPIRFAYGVRQAFMKKEHNNVR